ncbi:MAG: glutathione S-transferase C-terminal domain-containing protein [Methylobacter sp.]|nr:glutathione S-transferase C-terminal domain-containing protein [Methylobacter sp.]
MGLYSPGEVIVLGLENINALADFLGDKPYFMGHQPSVLDATAFGFLANVMACPIESPVKDFALAQKNLNDYCQRMQAEFFPELPSLMR